MILKGARCTGSKAAIAAAMVRSISQAAKPLLRLPEGVCMVARQAKFSKRNGQLRVESERWRGGSPTTMGSDKQHDNPAWQRTVQLWDSGAPAISASRTFLADVPPGML